MHLYGAILLGVIVALVLAWFIRETRTQLANELWNSELGETGRSYFALTVEYPILRDDEFDAINAEHIVFRKEITLSPTFGRPLVSINITRRHTGILTRVFLPFLEYISGEIVVHSSDPKLIKLIYSPEGIYEPGTLLVPYLDKLAGDDADARVLIRAGRLKRTRVLWIAVLLNMAIIVLPIIVVWRTRNLLKEHQAHSRAHQNLCVQCGYNMEGLDSEAMCPECAQLRVQ